MYLVVVSRDAATGTNIPISLEELLELRRLECNQHGGLSGLGAWRAVWGRSVVALTWRPCATHERL